MLQGPSSTKTKRAVLQALLIEGLQTVKVLVDPARLGGDHGFPSRVLGADPEGIPLDRNPPGPAWPLEIDLETDPDSLGLSLSFGGQVCRCRVRFRAISMIAVGVGGVGWQYEDEAAAPVLAEAPTPSSSQERRARSSHLRLVD